jgi:hypothetical protein
MFLGHRWVTPSVGVGSVGLWRRPAGSGLCLKWCADDAYKMHMSPRDAVRLSVSVTGRQHDALKQEADRLEISIGELLRRILDEWVDAKEPGE